MINAMWRLYKFWRNEQAGKLVFETTKLERSYPWWHPVKGVRTIKITEYR